MQLAYLLSWPKWLVSYQEMSVGIEAAIKQCAGEDSLDQKVCLVSWRQRRGKGGCNQWSAADLGMRETRRSDLEEERER